MSVISPICSHDWEDNNLFSYPQVSSYPFTTSASTLLFSSLDLMTHQPTPSPTITNPSEDFEILDCNNSYQDFSSDSSEYTPYNYQEGCKLIAIPADYLSAANSYFMQPAYLEQDLWYVSATNNSCDMLDASNLVTSDNLPASPGGQIDSPGSLYYIGHNKGGVSLKGDSTDLCEPPEPVKRPSTSTKKGQTNKSLVRECQCPMCPRAFARKHDLQRHIRVHTGAKPYSCPCCHRSFARTDALRRHFRMEESCRASPQVQEMKTRRRKGRIVMDR
ncbi:hypothetical protein NQZ79_g177 [Umbelopsis isabellina]|nr:hypothetical protein NQZ79_g177 [Umbelopsis isabellina]